MKTKLLFLLLFAALGSNAQSLSVLTDGKTLYSEATLSKKYDHINMGLSVLSGESVSLGYQFGTNLTYKKLATNFGFTNTIGQGTQIFLSPNLSLGYTFKGCTLFIEYKYLYNVSKVNSTNLFGIGVRM